MSKQRLDQIIAEKKDKFISMSDLIWEYAETRFQESQSADALCSALAAEGFSVQRGVAGMSTAFVASFGSGKPVIGLLGEYDALSGLSQQAGIARQAAIREGGNGHGCGHNLLGAGSLAAAVAVKQYMEENQLAGTIRYFGCPGEEGGSGKAFMAREGIFRDVDLALTWHPMTHNGVLSVHTLANYQVYFQFHGRSAHAAAVPHLGRSALDAVELMNIGVNYLREHIVQEARVHYAITNSGGFSPNVVQAEAEVLYLIRAPHLDQVQEIYERVCSIAKGAALMTGTEYSIRFNKACSNYIPNQTLEEVLHANFCEVGVFQLTEEEREFAAQIRNSLTPADKKNGIDAVIKHMGAYGEDIAGKLADKEVADIILPLVHSSHLMSGSTDVGDVSWIVPTAQLSVSCNAFGTPGHSWQTVAQGKSGYAHKGMLTAGKVMARAAVDVLLQPELIAKAQAELRQTLKGRAYVSPIPSDVKPGVDHS